MTGLSDRDEQLRREGMADAVVMMAMRTPGVGVSVDVLADRLAEGLTEGELRAALRRWKARYAKRQGAGPAAVKALLDGRVLHAVPSKVTGPEADRTCACHGQLWPNPESYRKHLAATRRAAERATCPECGRSFSAAGVGPHRRKAHGVVGRRAR